MGFVHMVNGIRSIEQAYSLTKAFESATRLPRCHDSPAARPQPSLPETTVQANQEPKTQMPTL